MVGYFNIPNWRVQNFNHIFMNKGTILLKTGVNASCKEGYYVKKMLLFKSLELMPKQYTIMRNKLLVSTSQGL